MIRRCNAVISLIYGVTIFFGILSGHDKQSLMLVIIPGAIAVLFSILSIPLDKLVERYFFCFFFPFFFALFLGVTGLAWCTSPAVIGIYNSALSLVVITGYVFLGFKFITLSLISIAVITIHGFSISAVPDLEGSLAVFYCVFFGIANLIGISVSGVIFCKNCFSALPTHSEPSAERGALNSPKFSKSVNLENRKYGRARLDAGILDIYGRSLVCSMEEQKIYRDSELTLPCLAEKLSLSPNELSQVINRKSGYSFNNFINFYRVRDVADALSDPNCSDMTIIEIAYQAGFRSKTTFNSAFKKFMGTTPKDFRYKRLEEEKE